MPKTIKEIINNKINKDIIYKNVINHNDNKRTFIYSLVFLIIIGSIIYLIIPKNNTFIDNTNKTFGENINNILEKEITFNDIIFVENYNTTSSWSSKTLKEKINDYLVPTYLDNINVYAVYMKDKNNKYSILHEYKISYNKDIETYINIAFSNKYTPFNSVSSLKEKKLIENVKTYYNDNIYISTLTYKQYNIVIESSNISEKDLIKFIKSVL